MDNDQKEGVSNFGGASDAPAFKHIFKAGAGINDPTGGKPGTNVFKCTVEMPML